MKTMKLKIALILLTFTFAFNAQADGRRTPPVEKTATAPTDGGWFQPFWDLFNW